MGVPSCSKCDKCKTGLSPLGINFYHKPKNHKWIKKYNSNTGKPYYECSRCLERKGEKNE
jgi:hypothetical protein